LAREVGVGTSISNAVRVLVYATPVPIIPGLVSGKRFLLMVGAGFDSVVVAAMRKSEKSRFGALAYLFAAWRSMASFRHMQISVRYGNSRITDGASVIVSRSRLYGGPFVMAPNADLRMPGLHILILKDRGVLAAVKYGLALATGRLWRSRSVDYVTCDTPVEITSIRTFPCQHDGDGGLDTPLVVELDTMPLYLLAAYAPSVLSRCSSK
jgi:diacylglycerol kinase family enzyme